MWPWSTSSTNHLLSTSSIYLLHPCQASMSPIHHLSPPRTSTFPIQLPNLAPQSNSSMHVDYMFCSPGSTITIHLPHQPPVSRSLSHIFFSNPPTGLQCRYWMVFCAAAIMYSAPSPQGILRHDHKVFCKACGILWGSVWVSRSLI